MTFRPVEGAEPIPGYKLVRRLGTGGYGEVWKATAPGGLAKAIKIIFGSMTDARAEQELRALSRIKEVRHPFLLSLERFEIIDEQVFIVMELAEGSLLDRYDECRREGQAGIPRAELLTYMRDAADALDYMNDHYDLQHLDIKPQNLLLVGGRIKIADFGLVKDLEGTSATATGGVTPIYASPEAFDGKVSRFSDQYSLGIVYQEMLTGIRPFPGRTALQLAAQHMNSPPLLDPLPAPDRPIIARALAKVADKRFPTCKAMMDSLLLIEKPPPVAVPETPPPQPSSRPEISPLAQSPNVAVGDDSGDVLALDTIACLNPSPSKQVSGPAPQPADTPRIETPVAGVPLKLRPTLFIGLGGLANITIRLLRSRLCLETQPASLIPVFRVLMLDTDRASFRGACRQRSQDIVDPSETVFLPLHRPEHYRLRSRELLRWLDRRWLYSIPRSLQTEGIRPLGRLALLESLPDVNEVIAEALTGIDASEARTDAAARDGVEVLDISPRIVLLASISGGTGSGGFLDLAYLSRQVLSELGFASADVLGVLLHATGTNTRDADLARLNAFAALQELRHLQEGGDPYPGAPSYGLLPAKRDQKPFSAFYVLDLSEEARKCAVEETLESVADYLFLDSATDCGRLVDQYRQATMIAGTAKGLDCSVRKFRIQRLCFPRAELADQAADRLAHQLVLRWQAGADPGAALDAPQPSAPDFTGFGLDAELIADQFHLVARRLWDEEPELVFRKKLQEWLPPGEAHKLSPSAPLVGHILQKIDELLGKPDQTPSQQDRAGTAIEDGMSRQGKVLGHELSKSILDSLQAGIDQPGERLRLGEALARQVLQHVNSLTTSAKYLVQQHRQSNAELRQKLLTGDIGQKSGGGRWRSSSRKAEAENSCEDKLLEICWLRVKELILQNTVEALSSIASQVSHFLRQVLLAREKLFHFAATFAPASTPNQPSPAESNTIEILPNRAATVAEAATSLLRRYPGLLHQLEDRLQVSTLLPQGGFWNLLHNGKDMEEALGGSIRTAARHIVRGAIQDLDAAKLFLQSESEPAKVREALQKIIARVRPSSDAEWQRLFIVVPASQAGAELRALCPADVSPEAVIESSYLSDVLVCCEVSHLSLSHTASQLVGGNPAPYAELAGQVWSRIDIPWSHSCAAADACKV